jgi:hypothetical protein
MCKDERTITGCPEFFKQAREEATKNYDLSNIYLLCESINWMNTDPFFFSHIKWCWFRLSVITATQRCQKSTHPSTSYFLTTSCVCTTAPQLVNGSFFQFNDNNKTFSNRYNSFQIVIFSEFLNIILYLSKVRIDFFFLRHHSSINITIRSPVCLLLLFMFFS